MQDRNELNDIILDRNTSSSNTKKLLLAIAALSLILIVVLVIMNTLNSTKDEKTGTITKSQLPSAPTDVVDEPDFEPVEVIQEIAGESNNATTNLDEIAQKIKQESINQTTINNRQEDTQPIIENKPTQEKKIEYVVAPTIKTEQKPVITEKKPTIVEKKIKDEPRVAKEPTKQQKPVDSTPKVSKEQPSTPKPSSDKSEQTQDSSLYYVQVGSFTNEPDKKLFERIGANGFKYTTQPMAGATKILVGPFEGRQRANEALGVIKKNIEAGAFITKG